MADQMRKTYPAIKGLLWHRAQYYSFFIPNNWHKLQWSDDREGVIYAPDPADPLTVFAVDVKDLGTPTTADDLEALAEGFFEGIAQLPQARTDYRNQQAARARLELEARYTFSEGDETRKCWVRVYYHGTRQIAMTAQGGTPEKYDYWLPWFFEAMMTAKIHSEVPQSPL